MRVIIVILVIVLIGYIAYRYIKRGWQNVKFRVYFKSADLSGITLQDLISGVLVGTAKTIPVVIGDDIQNDNNYDITFSGLKAKLSYNGVVFVETSSNLESKEFTLKANSELSISDSTTFTLNKASLSLLKDKLSGGSPRIDFAVKVRVYGISIGVYKGNFNW